MLDLTHNEFETVIREAVNLGKKNERDRILEMLRDLRAQAQKSPAVTTNVNINAIITLIKKEI